MYKLILLFLIPLSSFAQTTTANPGRFEIIPGFFTNKYIVGNDRMNWDGVKTHMKTHDPKAAQYLNRASHNAISSYFFAALAVAGTVIYVTGNETPVKVAGVSMALGAGITSLGCALGSANKTRKARDHYNIKYGYE